MTHLGQLPFMLFIKMARTWAVQGDNVNTSIIHLYSTVGMYNTFMSLPFCPTWLRGTLPTCSIGCGVSSPVLTTPRCSDFSKYENHSSWLFMWFDYPSQCSTPCPIVRWSSSSNSPCVSSRRLALFQFWVLPTLRHNASVADFRVWFFQIWIRIFPNWCASSNTLFLCHGPSSYNTNIPFRPLLLFISSSFSILNRVLSFGLSWYHEKE